MSIELKDVTYKFKDVWEPTLENVSAVLESGEILSIVGHTGSGKSTLAQHMNLLLAPSSGEVVIDGERAEPGRARAHELRRKVGLVFQYPEHQFFAESVREEIAFAPRNWGAVGDQLDEKIREAASAVGLKEKMLDADPFTLSGGWQRRVAIASVLASGPDYVVFDEPAAGLDREGSGVLERLLHDLKLSGKGVALITHDLASALKISDLVLVLEAGRAVVCGRPEEVAEHLLTRPTKGIILPPFVRFAAALRARGARLPLVCDVEDIVQEIKRMKGGAM